MSINLNWDSLNNDFVSNFLSRAINCIIAENKHLLIGGFAYVDEFRLGEVKPDFEFTSLEIVTADEIVGEVKFAYNSNLFIKGHAYAPINPLQSSTKFSKRARLHMNLAESAAPGYINAWGCIQDLHIDGSAKVRYKKFTPEEAQAYYLAHNTSSDNDDDAQLPNGIIIITLSSFPIKSVNVSCSFDGSVLTEMIGKTVNDLIRDADKNLKEQNYTFSVPI